MKVILVSNSSNALPLFKEILKGLNLTNIIQLSSINEAKQKLRQEKYDYVIIQAPASDEFGTRGAKEIAISQNVGVILLVKSSIYDQVLYQVRESGVFVVAMPSTKQVLYQSINFMVIHQEKVKALENEIQKHKKKLQDEKIIMRAKLMLVEQYSWSEERAHKFIEKSAMDQSRTKLQIARELLEGNFREGGKN
ncbi:MAG: ANTAR domain-containing protein [Firmicutes bacterium]|nr:ANTAR domain-containing protein [Bacillota bacterium]